MAKRYYDLAAETSTDAIAPVALAMFKLKFVFFFDYMKENLAWHSALIMFLDSTLGPHWDFFAMSVILAIIPYLLLQYMQNRGNGNQQRPPVAPVIIHARGADHPPLRPEIINLTEVRRTPEENPTPPNNEQNQE